MSSPPLHRNFDEVVDDGWESLQSILASLAVKAQSATTPQDFYAHLLETAIEPLQLAGGVVWQRLGGSVQAICQQRPDLVGLVESRDCQRFHLAIVEIVGRDRGGLQVPPRSTVQGIVNPTDCTLVFAPVNSEGHVEFVLEFFTHQLLDPDSAAGLLSMAEAIAAQAAEFHRIDGVRKLRLQLGTAEDLQQFAVRVHARLGLASTAMTIVNDALTVLQYDRASLLEVRGRQARVLAISGTDGFDRRSVVVRNLERLAKIAVIAGELEYPAPSEIATEVEGPLAEYVDNTHAESVRFIPLRRSSSAEEDSAQAESETIGVLCLERFANHDDLADRDALPLFTQHAASALDNAILANRWLWFRFTTAWVGEHVVRQRGRVWRRWILVTLCSAAVIIGMLPVAFRVAATGQLEPRQRQEVFAPLAGIVAEIHVREGENVTAGTKLLTLQSPSLELQISENIGKRQASEAALASARSLRLQASATEAEKARAAADEEELKATIDGIAQQFEILEQQQAALVVRSTQAGRIITRDVIQRLSGRPVKPGDLLLSVADVDGSWQLALELPEHQLQHVLAAQSAADGPLEVRYLIASSPSASYLASVESISDTAQLSSDQQPMVPLIASVASTPEAARPQATVYAQIHCGTRPLAYVWLHDVWEAAKIYWWQ